MRRSATPGIGCSEPSELMKIEKLIRVFCLPGPPADEVGGLRSCAPSMGLSLSDTGPSPNAFQISNVQTPEVSEAPPTGQVQAHLRPIFASERLCRRPPRSYLKGIGPSPIHRALLRSTGTSCPCGRRPRYTVHYPDYSLKVHQLRKQLARWLDSSPARLSHPAIQPSNFGAAF